MIHELGGTAASDARRRAGQAVAVLGAGLLGLGTALGLARPDLSGGATEPELVVGYLALVVLAFVLVRSVPGNAVAWLVLLWACGSSAWFAATQSTALAATLDTPHPGWAAVAAWVTAWAWISTLVGPLVLLRFPTGELPSPRWRVVWWSAVMAIVTVGIGAAFGAGPVQEDLPMLNPLGIDHPFVDAVFGLGLILVPVVMLASAVSLVVRYRYGSAIVRLQLRWVLSAALLLAVGAGLSAISSVLSVPDTVEHVATALGLALFAVAVARAVTRHRLYDLDRLVDRTVTYLVVTAVAITVYAVLVLAVSTTLGVGDPPDAAVASATLVAAAMFRPVLAWTRRTVDRRFHRARYDASRSVVTFGQSLRDETDLSAIQRDLRQLVREVLAPTTVSTWVSSSPWVEGAAMSVVHPAPSLHDGRGDHGRRPDDEPG